MDITLGASRKKSLWPTTALGIAEAAVRLITASETVRELDSSMQESTTERGAHVLVAKLVLSSPSVTVIVTYHVQMSGDFVEVCQQRLFTEVIFLLLQCGAYYFDLKTLFNIVEARFINC